MKTNTEITRELKEVAAALEVKGANRFRTIAYDRAATAVEHAAGELKDLWDDHKLQEIPGIGENIAQYLDELFRTGKVKHFEKVKKGLPPAMFPLLAVPGIGPKTAFQLTKELDLKKPEKVVENLIKAAKEGKIAPLEGFGEKSQEELLKNLQEFQKGREKKSRLLLSKADSLAEKLIDYLSEEKAVLKAEALGSLRRRVCTVGDLDVAVATRKPEKVINWFARYPKFKKILQKGENKASALLRSGPQVDLRVQKPEAFGAMCQYFIGSKHHNIHLRDWARQKGLSLSEHGIKKEGKIKPYATQKAFYNALGLPLIPPELREDTGEIEAAQKGKLPDLVTLSEIKGDFHVHSDLALETSHDEGDSSMEEMVQKAIGLGYEYLGFSEHNPSLSSHSEKDILKLMAWKEKKVEKIKKKFKGKIIIINGLEIDIRPNGSLALPEKAFKTLDFAVASIHSSFNLDREKMTKRVLTGLDHPKVKILGHPTGRKLQKREGFELDWDKLFSFCLKNKKFLEINAHPERLDLPESLIREAVKKGVKMVINSDAHMADSMSLMKYGVDMARRGWAEPGDILNTYSYAKMIKVLKGGD